MRQTKTNTTEKRDDKTTEQPSRKKKKKDGENEEDINSPEITHEDDDRHKQDIGKTQLGQCTELEELVCASEKEDNSMDVVDSSLISRKEGKKLEDNMQTLKHKKKMKIKKSGDPKHEQPGVEHGKEK
jgi:hypothetical protein